MDDDVPPTSLHSLGTILEPDFQPGVALIMGVNPLDREDDIKTGTVGV